ncbi:MAG TPA: hypothetical protein VFJ59_15905 [Pseudolabrys sp.]|nr:hypothetical protein [Pseudolabrys sp.]
MSRPTIRFDSDILRVLVIGAGLGWSFVFVVVALRYELELYADGAMFSYAVAVRDVWAFHWHNISGRLSVFLLSLWPAEAYVGLTGDPAGGIVVYGFLFYTAPLLGLIGTFVTDRSRGRLIFVYACCSTALLCPLVFGFPTEMWFAHALFWPTLAASHYAPERAGGAAFVLIMMLALVFTHEGALILALAIVATLVPRGLRDGTFVRAAIILIAVFTVWTAIKFKFPPDDYFAGVLMRAAVHFFDPMIFETNLVLLLFLALAGYGLIFCVFSRLLPSKAHLCATATAVTAVAVYWLCLDHSVHAGNRYYLRTALVVVTPVLGALAALHAMYSDGRLAPPICLRPVGTMLARAYYGRALAGAFLLVTLVLAIETTKFVAAWTLYKSAVVALATGDASDPMLGDAHFVSSDRVEPDLNRLSWFSTTPYLSVIVARLTPNRLVIDPEGNYFWLSCETATANYQAVRAVPAASRNLVRIYACLHR